MQVHNGATTEVQVHVYQPYHFEDTIECTSSCVIFNCIRAVLAVASIVATVTVIVWLRSLRHHSCAVVTQYYQAEHLEAAVDAFQPVNATMHSIQNHTCHDCWPFGMAQPHARDGEWLEGTYTYQWHGAHYESNRLAAASRRGHISLYPHLQRGLANGTPVTAWVDPAHPATAVLDRTRYTDPDAAAGDQLTCYIGALVIWILLFSIMAPAIFFCVVARPRLYECLDAVGVHTDLFSCMMIGYVVVMVVGVALIVNSGAEARR